MATDERGRGEGQDGGEKARKGAQRYLYCEGAGRRQMHAVPVADQVHLGESYKFTVINPGRGGRDGRAGLQDIPGLANGGSMQLSIQRASFLCPPCLEAAACSSSQLDHQLRFSYIPLISPELFSPPAASHHLCTRPAALAGRCGPGCGAPWVRRRAQQARAPSGRPCARRQGRAREQMGEICALCPLRDLSHPDDAHGLGAPERSPPPKL